MKITGIIAAIILQLVSVNLISAQLQGDVRIATEAYVDDIPFNTAEIARQYYDTVVFLQKIDPEAYVDDIPFRTETVVVSYKANEAMHVRFTMQEEASVQDIPFDTYSVYRTVKRSDLNGLRPQQISK